MTKKSFSFGQLLGTSFLSIFVGVLVTVAAITIKPHTETAAATVPTVASVSTLHAVVIVEAPTVAHVEVMPEATITTVKAPHHQTHTTTANASEGDTLTPEEIQRVKDYLMAHRVHVDIVEVPTTEPAQIIAAK